MKRIISTKGLPDGKHDAPWTVEAIHDRIDFKLAVCYRQDYGDDIQVTPQFFYELTDSQVCSIELSYTIDNPIPERLKSFREACENYYNLYGFEVEEGDSTPRVYIRVTDLYDMASFDDTGKTGNRFAFVLEQGEYRFYAGNSVRTNTLAGSASLPYTVIEQLDWLVDAAVLTDDLCPL